MDVSKISRLLDHISYDDEGLCEYDYNTDDNLEDVCFYPVNDEVPIDSDKGDIYNMVNIQKRFMLYKYFFNRKKFSVNYEFH